MSLAEIYRVPLAVERLLKGQAGDVLSGEPREQVLRSDDIRGTEDKDLICLADFSTQSEQFSLCFLVVTKEGHEDADVVV